MIDQKHSGSGDNVAGNKTTSNYIAISSIWVAVVIILGLLAFWLVPRLMPEPAPLSGYVVSNAEVPEAGVSVQVTTPDLEVQKTFTDENGFFQFPEVDLRKTNAFAIEARLKERFVATSYQNMGPDSEELHLQLPPGTPPFEVSYYDIMGVSLNYLYDGLVDYPWEKRLDGQPFIIPNEVYETFKDLGEQYYYDGPGGRSMVLDPNTGMRDADLGEREYSRELRGIAFGSPDNENVQDYENYFIDAGGAEELIRELDDWRKYSTSSGTFEPVDKAVLLRLLERGAAALQARKYEEAWEPIRALNEYRAFPDRAEIDFLLEKYDRGGLAFRAYLARENLPDQFIQLALDIGCGDELAMYFMLPTYFLKVAVLENPTSEPIALDSFYINRTVNTALRKMEEAPETEQISRRLFPRQSLKPGAKLLIPLSIVFRASYQISDLDFEHREFLYGPSWSIESVRVESQRFPFREKDSDLVALYFGGGVGSCPYAYTFSEKIGGWLLEDHILYGRNAAEKAGFDEIPLRRFTGELLIKEEDPESSFIDLIEIRLESKNGASTYYRCDLARLQEQDGAVFRMEQGDQVKLTFPDFDREKEGRYYLRSHGHYVPYSGNVSSPDPLR